VLGRSGFYRIKEHCRLSDKKGELQFVGINVEFYPMGHKLILEVKHKDVNEANFSKWAQRISDRWQAEVIHEKDGSRVQHFENGDEIAAVSKVISLEQWVNQEFAEANREFAEGWNEVGRLLESKNLSEIDNNVSEVVNS
jgi:hypothetical protein